MAGGRGWWWRGVSRVSLPLLMLLPRGGAGQESRAASATAERGGPLRTGAPEAPGRCAKPGASALFGAAWRVATAPAGRLMPSVSVSRECALSWLPLVLPLARAPALLLFASAPHPHLTPWPP
jgi:hypothetical protein